MKPITKQSAGFIATLFMVAGLAAWLLFQLPARPHQRCAAEPFENIQLIKLI